MNNITQLTAGNAVYAQKRAKKKSRIEELTFDPESRKDFLTGFHKRKAQRQKKAAEFAKEQARKERIESRKEIREARKADIEKRLQAVNERLQGSDEEDDDMEEDNIIIPTDSIWENHFEDNEKLTTVTIIEDFEQGGLENAEGISKPIPEETKEVTVPAHSTKSEALTREKKKKKAFRYGTKAERQADRRKAKLKKHDHHKSHKRK